MLKTEEGEEVGNAGEVFEDTNVKRMHIYIIFYTYIEQEIFLGI